MIKMKNRLKILVAAALAVLTAGCAKPGEEYVHSDNSIRSISITPATGTSSATITGVITAVDEEKGLYQVEFPIPRKLKSTFDITKLKVRATVGYDVKITPSLSGIKDLSDPYEISVEATQTGNVRKYTLQAYYER